MYLELKILRDSGSKVDCLERKDNHDFNWIFSREPKGL